MYTTKANLSRSLRLASAITAAGILLLANLRFPYTFSFFFEDITGFMLVFIFFLLPVSVPFSCMEFAKSISVNCFSKALPWHLNGCRLPQQMKLYGTR